MEASEVSVANAGCVSTKQTRPAAVQVRRAIKSYCENVPILNNLNMTVPQGSIYSLLGSSGCGKTTMLSCIVGTLQLDSGNVFVFGNKPGSPGSGIPGPEVGYMPQGVTLYLQLSIMETLQYFGRISGMTETQISSRSEFLINFLDLPSPNQRISSLSGGQQRRTSLAVCLLHEPPLLILDEPTVGVDPLLRESIWNHLCEIVQKHKTTVIITTHYIEETRQSDTVGLMRNGRLLTEKSPAILLKEHGSNLLEKIILTLCMKDEGLSTSGYNDKNSYVPQPELAIGEEKFKGNKVGNVDEPVIGLSYRQSNQEDDDTSIYEMTSFRKSHKKDTLQNWFLKCKAVFIRNLLILLRNPVLMYMAFCAPIFHIVLVSGIVGKVPKHTRFGVVDPEINNDFSVCWKSSDICDLNHLSCKYLELLAESKITPVFMDSIDEALQNVESGNVVGYMAFPHNYSENILNRFIDGRFALEESLEQSTIAFRLDMSNYFTGYILQTSFIELYQQYLRNIVQGCNRTEDAYKVEVPLKQRAPVYGNHKGAESYTQSISIGLLVVLSFFLPGCTSSYAMIVDRMQGTLDRSMVAGASKTNVLLPYYFTEGFVVLVQTALSCFAIIFIFGWEIQGSTFDFIVTLILIGICGVTLGILDAQVVKDLYESINMFIMFFITHLLFIGVMWPMDGNPFIVRMISKFFPLSHIVEALRAIMFRGWRITHGSMWPSYGFLIATALISLFLSIKFWRVR